MVEKDLQQICVTVGCPLPKQLLWWVVGSMWGCINIMLLERLMKIWFTATIMFNVLWKLMGFCCRYQIENFLTNSTQHKVLIFHCIFHFSYIFLFIFCYIYLFFSLVFNLKNDTELSDKLNMILFVAAICWKRHRMQ